MLLKTPRSRNTPKIVPSKEESKSIKPFQTEKSAIFSKLNKLSDQKPLRKDLSLRGINEATEQEKPILLRNAFLSQRKSMTTHPEFQQRRVPLLSPKVAKGQQDQQLNVVKEKQVQTLRQSRRPIVKVEMDLAKHSIQLVQALPQRKRAPKRVSVDRSILKRSLSQSAKSLTCKANQMKEDQSLFSPRSDPTKRYSTLWKVVELKI